MLYRLLKEFITNVYKHSDGNRAWVTLTQESGIIELEVSDYGFADAACLTAVDMEKHKGIASILAIRFCSSEKLLARNNVEIINHRIYS